MDDLISFRREIGQTVEATGRMLKRKRALSHQDLTDLRDTLNMCASAIQITRDIAHDRETTVE